MLKRTDIESILIIGAEPIIIGQACEFDYLGLHDSHNLLACISKLAEFQKL
ncbi:MAG: hypothetical protein IIA72_14420 [Proteobacteria bacterium]|nr:hypothetical protein [Pseudomonadota bacterium]